MLPLSKLEILKEGGYQVVRRGREVEIIFATPPIGDTASDPELGGERRRFVVKGVVEGDGIGLTEAYVEEPTGKRNGVNIRDLELWIQYISSLIKTYNVEHHTEPPDRGQMSGGHPGGPAAISALRVSESNDRRIPWLC